MPPLFTLGGRGNVHFSIWTSPPPSASRKARRKSIGYKGAGVVAADADTAGAGQRQRIKATSVSGHLRGNLHAGENGITMDVPVAVGSTRIRRMVQAAFTAETGQARFGLSISPIRRRRWK